MKTIYSAYLNSPIGWIEITATDTHICSTRSVTNPGTDTSANSPVLREAMKQLEEYFSGTRKEFNLPLALDGTSYQQQVWKELQNIPYGKSISYQELATRAGNSKACRAAGSANGKNPVFIIVPCHRVVRSNGETGGFAYGTGMKQFLLDWEKKNA